MSKPTCHSYARFSSLGKQSRGESENRQVENAERWCKRKKLPLSPLGTDRGLSGFHGTHRKKGKLKDFLDMVKAGQIPSGDILLVEKVSRLSREGFMQALKGVIFDLIDAGIVLQFIDPEMAFDAVSINGPMAHVLIALLQSAYQESKDRSDYAKQVWVKRRERARANKKPMFNRLPAWLTLKGGAVAVIPERAAAVQRIFELAAAGYGQTRIVSTLVKEKVAAFGKKQVNAGCSRSQFRGEWTVAYISKILRDRTALGEMQPKGAGRKPEGDPIPDYYPAVITKEQWDLASDGREERKNKSAPRQSKNLNLFPSLVKDATDGETFVLHADGHSDGTLQYTYLVSAKAIGGRGKWVSFSYPVFERAILKLLREVKTAEVYPPTDKKVPILPQLREQLKLTQKQIADLKADIAQAYSKAISDVLRQQEAKETELKELIQHEEAKSARTPDKDWDDFLELVSGDKLEGKEDARLRLRAVLRRRVQEIRVLVVQLPKREKLMAAQVRFVDSELVRDYLIYHKSAANRNSKGHWQARSWTDKELRKAKMPAQFDLRSADPVLIGEHDGQQAWAAGWKDVERDLEAADIELLFAGCERHPLP